MYFFSYWTDDQDIDATENAKSDDKHTLEASFLILFIPRHVNI